MADLSKSTAYSKYGLSVWGVSIRATYVSDNLVHIKVPGSLLVDTVVPGVSSGAEVEIVLLKSLDILTNSLHLLGTRWLADSVDTSTNPWLIQLLRTSILTKDWNIDDVWIAVPLEQKSNGEYCMPMADPLVSTQSLLNCKTAILADQFSGVTDSTLALCTNSIGFLMGQCKLGCYLCSKGLSNVTSK